MPKMKLKSAGILWVVILCLLFFYVYQRIQILRIGYSIRDVDRQTAALQKENGFLNLKITELESPERIAAQVKKMGLDLMPPAEKQIVRVKNKL